MLRQPPNRGGCNLLEIERGDSRGDLSPAFAAWCPLPRGGGAGGSPPREQGAHSPGTWLHKHWCPVGQPKKSFCDFPKLLSKRTCFLKASFSVQIMAFWPILRFGRLSTTRTSASSSAVSLAWKSPESPSPPKSRASRWRSRDPQSERLAVLVGGSEEKMRQEPREELRDFDLGSRMGTSSAGLSAGAELV